MFRLASTRVAASLRASELRRETVSSTVRVTLVAEETKSVPLSSARLSLCASSPRTALPTKLGTAGAYLSQFLLLTALANRNPVCADSACAALAPKATATDTKSSPQRAPLASFSNALWRQSIVFFALDSKASSPSSCEAFNASRTAHCAKANVAELEFPLPSWPSWTSTTRARADRETRDRTPNAAEVTVVTVSTQNSVTHESAGSDFLCEVSHLRRRAARNTRAASSAEPIKHLVSPSSTS
mmetsp:Transcript_309/g.1167  ORF Transcript_309/g.1167 Transcript_309/m.1167 type:complete len:243 (+) Transcript_309:1003-1731(+)